MKISWFIRDTQLESYFELLFLQECFSSIPEDDPLYAIAMEAVADTTPPPKPHTEWASEVPPSDLGYHHPRGKVRTALRLTTDLN